MREEKCISEEDGGGAVDIENLFGRRERRGSKEEGRKVVGQTEQIRQAVDTLGQGRCDDGVGVARGVGDVVRVARQQTTNNRF